MGEFVHMLSATQCNNVNKVMNMLYFFFLACLFLFYSFISMHFLRPCKIGADIVMQDPFVKCCYRYCISVVWPFTNKKTVA